MSTDLSGSFAISAMQSPSRMVSSGSVLALGLVRGRERPRLSVTGRIMFMSGSPRFLDDLDESWWSPGQGGASQATKRDNENKRNPLNRRTQDVESQRIRRTQPLVVW